MKYQDALPTLRARTSPTSGSVGRVRARLDRALVPATAELSALPGVPTGAAARVKARLAQRPARRPVPVWPGATLAFAAVVVVAGTWIAGERAPERAELAWDGAGAASVADGRVTVQHDGQGSAVVDGDRLTIEWVYGTLTLDVPADVTAVVSTPEGAVEADGAGLVVVRDALGTRFERRSAAADGVVRARCGSGAEGTLAASVACDPLTASGWLNRARAHDERGATADVVLTDVERGLAGASDAAVAGELWALRTTVLVRAGRGAEALDAAESALATAPDPARSEALHRTAARLALSAGDCARALPHLAALPALTVEEQAHRDRCAR